MTSHIFVVGASRSGTTMMARLISRSKEAYDLGELHFLEQSFPGSKFPSDEPLDSTKARNLATRIQSVARNGYFFADEAKVLRDEVETALKGEKSLTAKAVYERATRYEAKRQGGSIPIDQTPRNVFYIEEILRALPEARVIAMVRDPRDVLLSQKRRWKRASLGGNIPRLWTIRSWANYHPKVLAMLWRASAAAIARAAERPEVLVVRYEQILDAPEITMRWVCDHCGVPYDARILDIDQVGSSTESDNRGEGIDAANQGKWRSHLSPSEIAICERDAGELMRSFEYQPSGATLTLIGRLKYALSLPAKASIAVPLQITRIRGLKNFLRKRMVD